MKLPREGLESYIVVNFTQFQLLAQEEPTISNLQMCTCSWSSWHTPCGSRVGRKDSVLQISGICVLISDCCFSSQKFKEIGTNCWYTSHIIARSYPSAELTSRGPSRCLFCPFFILKIFPFWGAKIRTFKSNCIERENCKVTTHAQGKTQAQKRPMFTSQANLWDRDGLQQSKTQ